MYMTYLTRRRIFSKRVLRLVLKMNLYKAPLKSTLLPSNHHSNLSNTDARETPSFLLQDTVCMMTSPSLSLVFLLKSPNASCYKTQILKTDLESSIFSQIPLPRKSHKQSHTSPTALPRVLPLPPQSPLYSTVMVGAQISLSYRLLGRNSVLDTCTCLQLPPLTFSSEAALVHLAVVRARWFH